VAEDQAQPHVDTDKNLRDRCAALGELADFCVPAPWLDERLQSMWRHPRAISPQTMSDDRIR